MKLRINHVLRKLNPRNCPIFEQTIDGVEIGVCAFFMPDGKTCPRHGDVTKFEEASKPDAFERWFETHQIYPRDDGGEELRVVSHSIVRKDCARTAWDAAIEYSRNENKL